MDSAKALQTLFDNKKIAVLQYFAQKPTSQHTLSEVVDATNVPLATTHRILKELEEKQIVDKQKQKHLSLYELANSQLAKHIATLLYTQPDPLLEFTDKIRSIKGIQQIILHGKPTDTRADIVVVADEINKELVNEQVAIMREQHDFRISHLILDQEQFSMLESMGQFSGQKKILYDVDKS